MIQRAFQCTANFTGAMWPMLVSAVRKKTCTSRQPEVPWLSQPHLSCLDQLAVVEFCRSFFIRLRQGQIQTHCDSLRFSRSSVWNVISFYVTEQAATTPWPGCCTSNPSIFPMAGIIFLLPTSFLSFRGWCGVKGSKSDERYLSLFGHLMLTGYCSLAQNKVERDFSAQLASYPASNWAKTAS